jgi:hypothetical protein
MYCDLNPRAILLTLACGPAFRALLQRPGLSALPHPFPKRESPPFHSIFHLTSPAQNGNPESAVLIFDNPAQAKRLAKFFVGKILQEGHSELQLFSF